jgi:murein DD-endopeptidase MepM/ murein hydrolase activator NlpD
MRFAAPSDALRRLVRAPARSPGGASLSAALVAAILIGILLVTRGSGSIGMADVPAVNSLPSASIGPVAANGPEIGVEEPPSRSSLVLGDSRPAPTWPPPAPTMSPTQAPAPEVVRFRPRDGWTGVAISADLSVRFTQSMDHSSTEAAFHALVGTTEIGGSVRWAEADTVLVLDTATSLPYGAAVVLRVDGGATSADGVALAAPAQVTFTVQSKPVAAVWKWPLVGPITQLFGQSLTKYGVHNGIDIDGETGDPVRAARTGEVTVAGQWDECGGLQIHIDHGHGIVSWYRHLSRIDVRVGDAVTVGTVIGAVGATGCALGSHLHFGIAVDGTFVDPLRYLPPR